MANSRQTGCRAMGHGRSPVGSCPTTGGHRTAQRRRATRRAATGRHSAPKAGIAERVRSLGVLALALRLCVAIDRHSCQHVSRIAEPAAAGTIKGGNLPLLLCGRRHGTVAEPEVSASNRSIAGTPVSIAGTPVSIPGRPNLGDESQMRPAGTRSSRRTNGATQPHSVQTKPT